MTQDATADREVAKPEDWSGKAPEGGGAWARGWRRVPVAIRSVVVGFLVLVAGNFLPQGMVAGNLRTPAVPWSALLVGVYLWAYWHYVAGRWWPSSTAAARRRGLRAVPLPAGVWRWSLLAGALGITALMALSYTLARMVPVGAGAFPETLRRLPGATLIGVVVTVAVTAGVAEEAAFRGYMQGALERRHGPVVAILAVSVLFLVSHFPGSALAVPRALPILIAGVGYGILAHLTGSILPGVVIHVAQDLVGAALLWWATPADPVSIPPAWSPATGPAFWLPCLAAVGLFGGTAWAFRRVGAAAHRAPVGQVGALMESVAVPPVPSENARVKPQGFASGDHP